MRIQRQANILKIFTYNRCDEWNNYVKSFANWDIYYLNEYAVSLMFHGDGEPLLICYEDENSRMCYVVMKKDISDCIYFKNYLPGKKYFDFETPYGYGGPLVEGDFSEQSQKQFAKQLNIYCNENNIVSQFIRFHPLFQNQKFFSEVSENKYMRDTVYIDTTSVDEIFRNMDSKNRNMVRKAQKYGIDVTRYSISDYKDFLKMYFETMNQHEADNYYYFNQQYFNFLQEHLKENSAVFYAMLDDKPVSGGVFLFNEKTMHYHLSGMKKEYRKFAPGNLLIYQAAVWACKRGITKLHLGGGLKANDNLFGFKKQFNKNGRTPFYIGRTIFIKSAYDDLLKIRKQSDSHFDLNNDFLIQYRG